MKLVFALALVLCVLLLSRHVVEVRWRERVEDLRDGGAL